MMEYGPRSDPHNSEKRFSSMHHTHPSVGAFFFRKKIERIDWRKLAGVDIDRVLHQLDFEALQENLNSVAFCDIESEIDTRYVDPNFVKIFKLSQLIIEYLLHSQEYLSNYISGLEQKVAAATEDSDAMQSKLASKQHDYNQLKIECHRRKKLLIAQQQLLDSGPQSYHRCTYCEKAFLNQSFLNHHMNKRHSEKCITSNIGVDPMTDRSMHSGRDRKHAVMSQSLEMELRQMLKHVKISEGKEELDWSKLDAWKESLMEQHKTEMAALQNRMETECHDLQNHNAILERKLREMSHRQQKKGGNIGEIEDDDAGHSPRTPMKRASKFPTSPRTINSNQNRNVPQPKQATGTLQQHRPVRIEKPLEQSYKEEDSDSHDSQQGVSHEMFKILKQPRNHDSMNSLDDVLLRRSDLLEQLRQDPDVLIALKHDMENLLEENLAERGITAGTRRITNPVLNDKLSMLRKEREQLSRKYINFGTIRQALIRQVDKLAQDRMDSGGPPSGRGGQRPITAGARAEMAPVLRRTGSGPSGSVPEPPINRQMYNSLPTRGRNKKVPNNDDEYSDSGESEMGRDHVDGSPSRHRANQPPESESSSIPSPRKPRRGPNAPNELMKGPNGTDQNRTPVLPPPGFKHSFAADQEDDSSQDSAVTPMLGGDDDNEARKELPDNSQSRGQYKVKSPTLRGSLQLGSTDGSNTEGTSQWGTMSKFASEAKAVNANRSADLEMHDFE